MGKLFYGTQTGTTAYVADQIQAAIADLVDASICIQSAKAEDLAACNFLVLGGSTWGDGELTDDWADFFPQLDRIDFTGKTVAFFALGDQVGYNYNFVSSMRTLYDKVRARGGNVVADRIPTQGFDFDHSEAVVDGYFVGLALDEVNEPELTESRIAAWAEQVRAAVAATAIA
jgi:flavodoxin I